MRELQRELDVVANNIANLNTTGFKADNVVFHEHLMPAARANAFRGSDRRVSFVCEVTGTRRFDLNKDGVAHYGLFADLLASMQRRKGGRRALRLLFGSAEAYVETWQRALAHR